MPLLWAVVVVLAAALRLADLGAAPLNQGEASEALAAFLLARGVGTELVPSLQASGYSPLLLHANTLLLVLLDSGDGIPRLVPALCGVALVLTPLLLRRYLGDWGALGTGLLLALSPTALFFSRALDGVMPAALGAMLLVGCAARFLDTWRPGLATWAGLGLALAVTAGSAAWGLLLGMFIALACALWLWRDQVDLIWSMVRPALGRGLTAAVLGTLALGTGMGLYPSRLSAIGEQFLAWLARFRPPAGALSPSPFLHLVAYEPLVLLAGLAGVVLAVRRRHGMGLLWTFWAAVSGLQVLLMPGREPADLLWVLLPLAGLGGLAVEELVRSLETSGRWLNEGLYAIVSLVLWTHCGLSLARYSRLGTWADLVLAGMTVLLQILLAAAFGFTISIPGLEQGPKRTTWQGAAAALRAGGLSLGLVLLVVTFSTGWRLAHVRPADPRELPVQEPTAVEVRTLVDVVEQVSQLGTGIEARPGIVLLGDVDPALLWALRRFDPRVLDHLEAGEEPPLVVAPTQEHPPYGYFGEVFPVRRTWSAAALACSGWPPDCDRLARWWLYRSTSEPPATSRWRALWVRGDLATR